MVTEFIPPYPKRPQKKLGVLEMLLQARKDPLSIWSEDSFKVQFKAVKVLNRHLFIANCPDVVRDVLVARQNLYEAKSAAMQKAFTPLLGDSLFISDGEIGYVRRQLLESCFTDTHIAGFVPYMTAAVQDVRDHWTAAVPHRKEVQVLPEMLHLSTAMLCRALFGNALDEQQIAEIVRAFSAYQATIEQMDIGSFLGVGGWFPGLQQMQAKRAAERIHKLVDGIIAKQAKQPNPHSLLASLLDANDIGHSGKLSLEQIRNELLGLIMGGYETVGNTLAWSWYLISQRLDVEERLYAEIDQVLGSRLPAYEDLPKLVYVRAILEETMRLYPPVPILSRQSKVEDKIRKSTIPAGSTVLIIPWLLHRHKQFWQKPDHFMPERFLPTAQPEFDPDAYLPFGSGARACLGRSLAMAEMTLCLAMLARQFRLCLPAGHQVSLECRLTLRPKGNLPMRLESRR